MTQAACALFGRQLIEFNQFPSKTLHPSRRTAFAPLAVLRAWDMAPGLTAAWHRHWSLDILRCLGLGDRPVQDPDQPALALALLAPDRLALCARRIGAVLCAPRVRYTILGDDVRALSQALGTDVLDFSRRNAGVLHPGIAGAAFRDAASALCTVDALGRDVVRAALQGSDPALRLRAELKMLDEPARQCPVTPEDALALGLGVLQQTDPSWHSLFCAIR